MSPAALPPPAIASQPLPTELLLSVEHLQQRHVAADLVVVLLWLPFFLRLVVVLLANVPPPNIAPRHAFELHFQLVVVLLLLVVVLLVVVGVLLLHLAVELLDDNELLVVRLARLELLVELLVGVELLVVRLARLELHVPTGTLAPPAAYFAQAQEPATTSGTSRGYRPGGS